MSGIVEHVRIREQMKKRGKKFVKITDNDSFSVNHFVGSWGGPGEYVFVLDDSNWTLYNDGKIESGPWAYTRTSISTANAFYDRRDIVVGTFTLRDDNNTLVWTWGSGLALDGFVRLR